MKNKEDTSLTKTTEYILHQDGFWYEGGFDPTYEYEEEDNVLADPKSILHIFLDLLEAELAKPEPNQGEIARFTREFLNLSTLLEAPQKTETLGASEESIPDEV